MVEQNKITEEVMEIMALWKYIWNNINDIDFQNIKSDKNIKKHLQEIIKKTKIFAQEIDVRF